MFHHVPLDETRLHRIHLLFQPIQPPQRTIAACQRLTRKGVTGRKAQQAPPSELSRPSRVTLNPVLRFITGLYDMPWVSPERITVDYRPGVDRGAWVWKWTHAKNGSNGTRGRKVMVLKPIPKVLASWYTAGDDSGKKMPVKEHARSPSSVAPVDLLSSGASGTRSSMATSRATTSGHTRRRVPIRSSVFLPDPNTLPRSVRRSKPPSRPGTSSHSGRHRDHERRRRRTASPSYPHGYAPPTPPVPPFVFMPPPPWSKSGRFACAALACSFCAVVWTSVYADASPNLDVVCEHESGDGWARCWASACIWIWIFAYGCACNSTTCLVPDLCSWNQTFRHSIM
ncbi:hypothetical protein IW261DRAFT_27701 [Armillaria novae-zelandiae]|uniref:Uncharacterized protein n=1 Tax=Armillaria novae-zelandiae TaxID=153914 RepID=A0AA39PU82_9AGAR|nr:hypothetical protein IW261DRAFT_27701 [Armillaria novae-zelandiae]